MANEKNPLKIVLSEHRISYVHIKTPTAFKGDDGKESKPKYDCTFLIPYGHPDVDKINRAVAAAYAANKESVFKGVPLTSTKMWNPLRDGSEWLEEHPEATEYEGHYFIKMASTSQPAVYDTYKNPIFDLDEVYSGCYCRGVGVCYSFNNMSKGHAFFLNSIMKTNDGERLGGFSADPDDYDDYEDEVPAKAPKAGPKPGGPKKPARIWNVDEDGRDIYSDDGGNSWAWAD